MLKQHSHRLSRLTIKITLGVVISVFSSLTLGVPSFAEPSRQVTCQDGTKVSVPSSSPKSNNELCKKHGGANAANSTVKAPETVDLGDGSADPTKCQTSIIKINCDASGSGIWNLLLLVITILTAGVGLVAIGGFVYAAILYTTAEGDAGKVTKAKTTIFNVVLGLVAFALMYAFIQFLVPGGVFNRNYSLPDAPASTTTGGGAGTNGASSTGGTGSSANSTASTGSSISSITSVKNIRDASGSGALKSGVLYRSGAINGISAKDKATLASTLGGGTIINLSQPNDISIDGIADKHFALLGITNTKPLVTNAAQRTGVGNALKAAANASGPVLIHCTHGKDRTGWLTAMIMYASGANDAQVMAEYLKSNQAIPGGVQASWLSDGVQAARKQYGSVIKYLKKGCGLSDADIQKLKNKFGA